MSLLGLYSLLLVAPSLLLGGPSGSSWNSLQFFYTTMLEPVQDLPDFIALGYVNDQLIGHYNSTTRRAAPVVPWIRKAEKEEPRFWDRVTQIAKHHELQMKGNLRDLQRVYNRSGRMHTWQCRYGCELSNDGRKNGFDHYAFDGVYYGSFDPETLTWRRDMVPPQVIRRKRDDDDAYSKLVKAFLEKDCVEALRRLLDYGKESLLRREPPVVKVARKPSYDGRETLVCRAHGFHPKEINATWQKDGEAWEQETFHGGVVSNSDGTYYTWLSVKIEPKDRDLYRCRVEHDSLLEPLNVSWEEPASSKVGVIIGILAGVVASTLLVAGIIMCIRK
ncbi:class I histocompatibility antigen, F10 alpha chain-like [Eublepharis macularius]|uniref:Class I histocompatibility antigen, F10 alpha chain-like n=1 Tax=Eublepharis macularius TaxID=481883 RepID=A0AA97JBC6_EUBMA|nr:class I histocompatibility antigen, F10 alpha chain-like [Eublepharis macularius]